MTDTDIPPPPESHHDPLDRLDALRLGTLTIYGDRKELFAALAKAQASFDPIKRTRSVTVRSDKGNYSFDYAPLEEVIDATRPALAKNGLAFVSMLSDPEGEGETELHTMVTHESGAFMHVCERLPPVNKAQERGSQITYRRRYQYQCATGTSPEVDDDGNEADGNKVEAMTSKRRQPAAPPPQERPKPPPAQPARPPSAPPPPPENSAEAASVDPPDDSTVKALREGCARLGYNRAQVQQVTKERYGAGITEITGAQAEDLLHHLRTLEPAQ